MGNSRPLSLTTFLEKMCAAGRKLASLSLVKGLLRAIPGLRTAALAGVVIMFFAWFSEHQARQREAAEAEQVKKQAAEQISRLQQQAAANLRDAQQSVQAARGLEAQRQKLVREAEGLRQSLESLRKQELARANEVATLPTSEVVSRVASRLQEQVTGNREQGTEQQTLNPLTRPALAGESASAGHPLPQGGEGSNSSGGEGSSNPRGEGSSNPRGEGSNSSGGEGRNNPGGGASNNAGGEGQKSPAALVLSEQGVRKVETAFIELDSCRQQAQVMGQQVANCEQQAKLDSAAQEQQSDTITKLKAALADKDQILAQSEEAHRAELNAARGTWRTRLLHAVEIFAGGFIAGVLVR
jgi:hypothetical protein